MPGLGKIEQELVAQMGRHVNIRRYAPSVNERSHVDRPIFRIFSGSLTTPTSAALTARFGFVTAGVFIVGRIVGELFLTSQSEIATSGSTGRCICTHRCTLTSTC